MADDTWKTQERPILEAVRAGELSRNFLDSESASEAVGLDVNEGAWVVQSLIEDGFLKGGDGSDASMAYDFYMRLRLTEKGRRAIGQWPATAADAFLAELDRRIELEEDPAARSRLERWREAASDVTKQVIAGVIVAAGQAGMQ
jgi:hypothetical protein